MKKIEAIVTRASDGFYNIHCNEEQFSGGGNNVDAAKEDMLNQMYFFKQTAVEDGFDYPSFLDDEFELVYKFDTASLLEYYSGILSLSGLERLTGIHQKQLWSYLHRKTKPRRSQILKIQNGLHQLGSELQSIEL
jgi:hypothetical protein